MRSSDPDPLPPLGKKIEPEKKPTPAWTPVPRTDPANHVERSPDGKWRTNIPGNENAP